jgi:hypothetical protein
MAIHDVMFLVAYNDKANRMFVSPIQNLFLKASVNSFSATNNSLYIVVSPITIMKKIVKKGIE